MEGKPVNLRADFLEYYRKEEKVIAKGNVKINCEDLEIECNEALFNFQEEEIKISGKATLKDKKSIIKGENLYYNLKTKQAKIENEALIKQTDHEYIAPDTDVPGTPGEEVWTFEVKEKGETTLSMEYSRPWEGGEKAEWTFELTITVK